jgi:hypothetical protein
MTDEELKDLVASLAVGGERLVANLAVGGERLVANLAVGGDRIERLLEESARRQESIARQHEELNQMLKELADRQEKTDKKLKKIGAQLGGVSNNNGYYSETFFQDVFEETLEFGGVKYDDMIPNFGRNDDEVKIEIDIVLINCDSIALIEAKYRVHPNDVTKLATERVQKFRTLYPKYDRYKAYLGIAGFSFCEDVLAVAKEYGVGVVKPAGEESVEMEVGELKAY